MKKTLLTLIAASAVILSFVGCKPATKDAIDNDSGSWKGQVSEITQVDTEKRTVTLTQIDGYPVDTTWFVWTDVHGLCISPQPSKTVNNTKNTITFDFREIDFTKINYNTDRTTEEFVLYMHHTNGTDSKKGDLTQKDVRGRVCVYDNRKVDIRSDKYYEVIEQVGLVSIYNNEPLGTSIYPNGNYHITEIWPLEPMADKNGSTLENSKLNGQFIVEDTMYFKELDIKKNETVTFPVKAGETIIGLYQPDRDKKLDSAQPLGYGGPDASKIKGENDADKITIDGTAYSRADLLGIKTNGKNDNEIIEDFKKKNDALIFAKKYTITAHTKIENNSSGVIIKDNNGTTITATNSGTFNDYWFWHKDKKRARTVDGYVDTVELHEGRLEK